MKGHEPLLDMRRRGWVPGCLWFVFDGDGWRHWPGSIGTQWKRFPTSAGTAEVLIEPEDCIARLDLRFAVGLRCFVMGPNSERVGQLFRALVDAGASRVLSSVNADGKAVDLRDSAGVMVGA